MLADGIFFFKCGSPGVSTAVDVDVNSDYRFLIWYMPWENASYEHSPFVGTVKAHRSSCVLLLQGRQKHLARRTPSLAVCVYSTCFETFRSQHGCTESCIACYVDISTFMHAQSHFFTWEQCARVCVTASVLLFLWCIIILSKCHIILCIIFL